MAQLVVSEAADNDTRDMLSYLAQEAGARMAAKYLGLLGHLYDQLEAYPESGHPRPKLGEATRIGIVRPFVVIYDYAADTDAVTILRILHGNRNLTRKLLRG